MSTPEIHITIKKDGEVSYEVQGVQGKGCLELTKDLDAALGVQDKDREMKPEFYQESVAVNYQYGG